MVLATYPIGDWRLAPESACRSSFHVRNVLVAPLGRLVLQLLPKSSGVEFLKLPHASALRCPEDGG